LVFLIPKIAHVFRELRTPVKINELVSDKRRLSLKKLRVKQSIKGVIQKEVVMKRVFLSVSFLLIVLTPPMVQAQKVDDLVSKYSSQNGTGYLQPLGDAFGANINSGLFHTAQIPQGFHLSLTLEAMGALISSNRKTFSATTEDPFSPTTTAKAPTVFGSVDPVSVPGVGGTEYIFPGGINLSTFPLIVPQLTVGSLLGTEAVVRYVQVKVSSDVGEIKLLGGGVRHSVSQYLMDFPIDLSVGIFIQKFDLGDIISANATFIGVQGSYSTGVLTLYGGPGYEKSHMDVSYNSDSGTGNKVTFKLDGANSLRFTVGAGLNLPVLLIHADYSLGSQSVVSAGIGFGL
jgi:hypothetical protein